MRTRMQVLLTALVMGALVAGLVPLALAGSDRARSSADDRSYSAGYFFSTKPGVIRGIVSASHRPGSTTAQAYISLHGLKASTTYLVELRSRACPARIVDGDDFIKWQRGVRTSATADDVVVSARVKLQNRVTATRGCIYQRGPNGYAPGTATVMVTDDD